MKFNQFLTITTAIVSCSAANGAVIFSLTSGDSPWVVENNTSYLSNGTAGWLDVPTTTLSDGISGTGLTATVSSGITGESLTTQGADHVGAGVDPTNGFTAGNIINVTFNQDVILDQIWFGHGGASARTGGEVTATVGIVGLSAAAINPTRPDPGVNQWVAPVVYNDTNVLAAGDVLSFELTTGATSALGLNAIQVTIIPEPSAIALLGMSGLVLLRRRRD